MDSRYLNRSFIGKKMAIFYGDKGSVISLNQKKDVKIIE
jgi:hypothetical protein